jgi:hypothetical protein
LQEAGHSVITVRKIYEGGYWASFVSKEFPADYRSSEALSAADVMAELSARGANGQDIEAAIETADREWILN